MKRAAVVIHFQVLKQVVGAAHCVTGGSAYLATPLMGWKILVPDAVVTTLLPISKVGLVLHLCSESAARCIKHIRQGLEAIGSGCG